MDWGTVLVFIGILLTADAADTPEPDPEPEPGPDPEPDPKPDPQPDPEPEPEPHGDDDYVPIPGAEPLWILPGNTKAVRPWSFGQKRPFSSSDPKTHHAGIDFDADELDPVVMPEAGVVVRNGGWAGSNAKATTVQLFGGPVLIFGAVHPGHLPAPGRVLQRGELVGRIGKYPGGSTMLHIEQWTVGAFKDNPRPSGPWKWGSPRPAQLVDPTAYLQAMER